MSESQSSPLLDFWAISWALVSLQVSMNLSFVRRLSQLPQASTPLLKLQISKLKLNANRMSHQQQREHNVVLLRRG